jgi:ribosomal protein S27E
MEVREYRAPEAQAVSGDNVISFTARRTECQHLRLGVDASLWRVECMDCGELIDPIWWMIQRAHGEAAQEYKITRLRAEAERLRERRKVKCIHCGRFTVLK